MSVLRWPWGSSEELVTQRLQPACAAVLAHIHAASFAHGWDEEAMAAMILDDMIQSDGLFASGQPVAPVAFVLSRCVLDEAEILTIAVSDRWRGRRASLRLLQHHLQCLAARGVRTVHLEVEEGNAPALHLYDRFGFIRTGERKGYYARADGSRATAVLMSREL
ncbi:GNAT family N-acetyltransferase [Camelimonas lactis]|uniref:Ribosomal-protein-alanine N-acetyltransferase n=1 Tax=Camelimonas lactis TaxID=659006 RepID=A0A4R2GV55_9HYPH|nr:GNAT family N-acetyltransferase [Camelimonas lactis]TCO14708.1 ribosomal-protein-alanine N-acetyltransferase [Camelimonas lactis]